MRGMLVMFWGLMVCGLLIGLGIGTYLVIGWDIICGLMIGFGIGTYLIIGWVWTMFFISTWRGRAILRGARLHTSFTLGAVLTWPILSIVFLPLFSDESGS